MGNIELVFPVLSITTFTHHLSTVAPVKSSFRRHFHAGDHSQEGKSFSCTTAGQGKTTASNGLDCDFSWACYFFFFFYFSIPFDAPTKQDDPSENKWKFDNSILSLFFFFMLFSFGQAAYLQPARRLCRSHWHSPPCPSFLLLVIASVAGKGAILQPRSPLLLFTGLWPLTCDRRGCSGSIFIKNQWLSSVFRCAVCVCLCWYMVRGGSENYDMNEMNYPYL